MSKVGVVELYWSGVARRLQEEVDTFNKLIGHYGEQGRENEQSLVRLMERLLPRSLGVGTGLLIDANGTRSKQTDLIIYDTANQPAIMAQTTQMLYPVESVFLVIEVKTTLDAEELVDCGEKKASIARLKPSMGRKLPDFGILAYHAQGTPPTVARDLRAISRENRPDLLCVIASGILAGQIPLSPSESDYPVGIAALHSRDSAGLRITAGWDRPTADERGSHVMRYGTSYPITRTGRLLTDRVIAEPGRALLNYCAILLEMLAARGATPEPFLKHYLRGAALELISL
jgi:hypothetical protein